MPQSAALIPCRTLVPAISQFDLFGFEPETLKTNRKLTKLR